MIKISCGLKNIRIEKMLDTYKKATTTEIIAQKVWQAANDNSHRLRYAVGGQGTLLSFLRLLLPLSWFIEIVSRQFKRGIKYLKFCYKE